MLVSLALPARNTQFQRGTWTYREVHITNRGGGLCWVYVQKRLSWHLKGGYIIFCKRHGIRELALQGEKLLADRAAAEQ